MQSQTPISNPDLENAIALLGRNGVAKAAGLRNAESVDGYRRRGVVPAKYCRPIVDAYKQRLKEAAEKLPSLSGLNAEAFSGVDE